MFGRFKTSWKCECLKTLTRVSARQEQILGWNQDACRSTRIVMVGGGGLGGEIGEGFALKGMGQVHIVDFDIVTPSNLNRQKFVKKSLYRNKAKELCRILSKRGFLGTIFHSHSCTFQELNLEKIDAGIVVCGVDNQFPDTRLEICKYCFDRGIFGVFVAVGRDADKGYVFIQEPGKACWACCFRPEKEQVKQEDEDAQCPGVPACCDILKTVSGFALYAVDTLIMNRPRDWNYKLFSLGESEFGGSSIVARREDCIVCGVQEQL